MTLPAFPAVDDVLCDVLTGYGTTGLVTPADLTGQVPFVQPHIIGGNGDTVTDYAVVDVDVFDVSIPAALARAGQVRAFLEQGPHVVGGVVIDRVTTITRPRWIPYGTTGVFRAAATYRVTSRRQT